ncbi:hypothetical protein HYQ46_002140 [Verticillium longisporum]|nr:hypothetical protein HYQ46_002140 [Verticillium longisporum]
MSSPGRPSSQWWLDRNEASLRLLLVNGSGGWIWPEERERARQGYAVPCTWNPHSLPPTCGSGFLVRTAMATGVVNGLVGSIVGIRVPEMSSSSAPSNGGVHEEPGGQGSRSSTVHVPSTD